jgi:hypothetical protein
MTFWSFGSSHSKKRKEGKPSSRPASATGYYGSNYSVSTVNLQRPSPGPRPPHQHQPPPLSRPWNGAQETPYGNPHAVISRPDLPMRPPRNTPSPYPQYQSYGPPPTQMVQWAPPAVAPNAVYPSHNHSSNQQSLLHLPSAVTGGLHKASKSVTNLNNMLNHSSTQYLNQGAALYDRLSSKLDSVITCMDEEKFSGDERDLRK